MVRAVNKLISMSKKIIFSSLFLLIFSLLTAFGASAQSADATLDGLKTTANKVTAFKDQAKQTDDVSRNFIQTGAGQIIGTVLSFVGVIFLILMIYAGIMWMTAQGNEQQVTKAKDLLINSIIGMIIIFAAYAITAFVGNFVSDRLIQGN